MSVPIASVQAQEWLADEAYDFPVVIENPWGVTYVVADRTGTTHAFNDPWFDAAEDRHGRVIIRSLSGTMYDEAQLIDTTIQFFANRVDISADGKTLVVGGQLTDDFETKIIRRYDLDENGNWVAQPGDLTDGINIDGYFQLSADGRSLVTAEPQFGYIYAGEGMLRVYDWLDGGWVQRGDMIRGIDEFTWLGTHLAFSGDGNTIAASGLGATTRVYRWTGTGWVKLQADIPIKGTLYLDYAGETLAVGRGFQTVTPDERKVRVYGFSGGSWYRKGAYISGVDNDDTNFGAEVALSDGGNTLIIGSPSLLTAADQRVGAAGVYRFRDGDWFPLGNIISGESLEGPRNLGTKVAVSGDGTTVFVVGTGEQQTSVTPFRRQIPTSLDEDFTRGVPKVFPVPVTYGRLYLKDLPLISGGNYAYRVVSTSGRSLKEGFLGDVQGIWSADVDGLPPGMYVLEVTGPEGRTGYKFVVR